MHPTHNACRQQFHICCGMRQLLPPGSVVGLVLPSLDDIESNMQAIVHLLPPG